MPMSYLPLPAHGLRLLRQLIAEIAYAAMLGQVAGRDEDTLTPETLTPASPYRTLTPASPYRERSWAVG
jgi:hypothetical protein